MTIIFRLLFVVMCIVSIQALIQFSKNIIQVAKTIKQPTYIIEDNQICDTIDYDDINQADWKSNNDWYNDNIK